MSMYDTTIGLLVSFSLAALVGCVGGSDGGTNDAAPPTNAAATTQADVPNPAWLVGSYEYDGSTSNNILMDHKTIVFAADGTYGGIYCKSCGNKSGKWSVQGTSLVLSGGMWGDKTVDLTTDMTANCRILTLESKPLHRSSEVATCPLGGKLASGDACGVVGTHSRSTNGNPSRTDTLVLDSDFYFFYSTMSIDSTCYGDTCKYLSNGSETAGTWQFVDGEPTGTGLPDISGLTFTRSACAAPSPSGSAAPSPSGSAAPSPSGSSAPAPSGSAGLDLPLAVDAGVGR